MPLLAAACIHLTLTTMHLLMCCPVLRQSLHGEAWGVRGGGDEGEEEGLQREAKGGLSLKHTSHQRKGGQGLLLIPCHVLQAKSALPQLPLVGEGI